MSVDVEERRRFTAAVLGEDAAPPPDGPSRHIVRGVVLEVTRHLLVLATPSGEERLLFEGFTRFWRGREATAAELRAGDDVLVRCGPGGRWLAERVWAGLARATGVITAVDGAEVRVDTGHGRPAVTAVIPYRSSGRMSVRHPALEPGHLFDAVGVWRNGTVEAVMPATTQPPYPVERTPRRPRVRRPVGRVAGIATWFDPGHGRATHTDPRSHVTGMAYPAIEPGADCGPDCDRSEPCLALPRLSLGSSAVLTNDATGYEGAVAVIACGSAASRFCDRCRESDADASGRLAELTLPSFVAMGGLPEDGCFPATLRVG